jgi:hypothetical protein
MQTVSRPYEFLVRWGLDGKLSGAHIIHRYVIEDGGVLRDGGVTPARPVATAGEVGFPLADILQQLQIDALAKIDGVVLQAQALQRQLDEIAADKAALEDALAGRDGLLAKAAAERGALADRLQAALDQVALRDMQIAELNRSPKPSAAQPAA